MQLNRIEPALPAQAFRTFQISAPVASHFRPASCAEVDCPNWLNGWRVQVEKLTPELLHAAKTSGRRHREEPLAPGVTWLVFEAGQPCFRAGQHRTPIGRPELYLVRDGDWRQSYGQARQHTRPEHWVEEMSENQQRLIDAKQRG
jgi:capsid protein